MNCLRRTDAFWMLALITLAAYGCGGTAKKEAHHDHDHAAAGPHGGHIIELGEEAFHAELKHDDPTHKVTIYLLDSDAKAMPPAAELPADLKATVMIQGKPYDVTLTKSADGQYDVVDEALCGALGGEYDVKTTLHATIAGKAYTGEIEHEHHDGHHHHHDPATK
jgi:hypothetical protein